VGAVAVGFDDQPLWGPCEVGLVALDFGVHLRLRQAVIPAQGEEDLLHVGPGPGGSRVVPGEQLGHDPAPSTTLARQ